MHLRRRRSRGLGHLLHQRPGDRQAHYGAGQQPNAVICNADAFRSAGFWHVKGGTIDNDHAVKIILTGVLLPGNLERSLPYCLTLQY